MKVYIASSFSLIDKVSLVCSFLESEGHEITVKWWNRVYKVKGSGLVNTQELKRKYSNLHPDQFYSRPETKLSYESDFQGVKDADCLVLVASNTPRAYNGANIELGIALSDRKPCFSIGNLQNSALYYPVIRCSGIQGLLYHLKVLEI